jgi:hypothetical protein
MGTGRGYSVNSMVHARTVAKFIVPDRGIYVIDSGIGLSYRPVSLLYVSSLAGRYDSPVLKSSLSSQ